MADLLLGLPIEWDWPPGPADPPAAAVCAIADAAASDARFFCFLLCPKSFSRCDLEDDAEAWAARSRAIRKFRFTDGPTTSTNLRRLRSSPSTATILSPTCSLEATGPLGSTSTTVFI